MNYLDWRAAQRSFTDLALARTEGVNVSASDSASPPERIRAARITANYLSILQVAPRIGRDLVEKDDVPGAGKVVLIGERLWRSRFGALPLALGQQLNVDGVPREIVGVVPEKVRFPRNCDIFVPLADLRADHDFLSLSNHEAFSCLGRLKPGVTLKQAITELDTIAADLARRFRFKYRATGFCKTVARICHRRISALAVLVAGRGRLRAPDRVRKMWRTCNWRVESHAARNSQCAQHSARADGDWRGRFWWKRV
jgi:hypothetical protein